MSFREETLSRGMAVIEAIFTEWCYDPGVDVYRAKDIANSLNETQWSSKEWLVEELSKVYEPTERPSLCIGGWYGLLPGLLNHKLGMDVTTVDLDELTVLVGKTLYPDINFLCRDGFEYFLERRDNFEWLINTSVEHIDREDIQAMVKYKHRDTNICFQSNNMFDEDSHINCSETLDEFVDYLGLNVVWFKGELPIGKYKRFMVIGK